MKKNEIFCIFDDCKIASWFLLDVVKKLETEDVPIEKVDRKNMCIEFENWRIVCVSVNSSQIDTFKDKVLYFHDGTRYFRNHEIVEKGIKYRFPPWAKEIRDWNTLIKILTGESE